MIAPIEQSTAAFEAIRSLADGLPQPVAIINEQCDIVYANDAARLMEAGDDGVRRQCYRVFFDRAERCPACPAQDVLTHGCSVTAACGGMSERGDVSMFPVMARDGETRYVLQLFPSRHAPVSGHAIARADRFFDLIGQSPAMRDLFEMIRLVADSQATVLLQGESGTGKELVARTIHRLSARRDRPFIVVDCGALPETLLESELFGHIKGAFTGAVATKRGLFEEADGGTLLLDEIADTSPAFQAKLLRVLQEGEIKAVGSSRPITVDVRVISATNQDLTALIAEKRFRDDLYYRLAVLPLMVPPLRDRAGDIPLLAAHFAMAAASDHRRPVRPLAADAIDALVAAPWPGNVRQLKHAIERAVLTATGPVLSRHDILGETTAANVPDGLRHVARNAAEQAERRRIVQALAEHGGRKTRAARSLKISRASLYNKLKAYGL